MREHSELETHVEICEFDESVVESPPTVPFTEWPPAIGISIVRPAVNPTWGIGVNTICGSRSRANWSVLKFTETFSPAMVVCTLVVAV
jgi:hypothetical protein